MHYLVINDVRHLCRRSTPDDKKRASYDCKKWKAITVREELKGIFERRITMIHPSYVDLIEKVMNSGGVGEEPVVNSRYSIVIATERRARQIIAGDEPLVRSWAAGKNRFLLQCRSYTKESKDYRRWQRGRRGQLYNEKFCFVSLENVIFKNLVMEVPWIICLVSLRAMSGLCRLRMMSQEADIIVINTCCFINDAKEESIIPFRNGRVPRIREL